MKKSQMKLRPYRRKPLTGQGIILRMTSEELYDLCRANDEAAWNYVYNYLKRFLSDATGGNADDIDEAIQKTLLYFLNRQMANVKHPKAFKSLLRLKARGEFIDRIRHTRRYVHVTVEDTPTDDHPENYPKKDVAPVAPVAEDSLIHSQLLAQVDDALDKTGSDCKTALKIYFLGSAENIKVKAMAREENASYSAFRRKIRHCLDKLHHLSEYKTLLDDFSVTGGL